MRAPIPQRPFIYTPPPAGPLPVLHADDHILVLDKPAGLLTVPGRPAEHADCLEARAQAEFPQARIIHRLDMDTSGVIILAVTAHAQRHIGLQFEKRQTEKRYSALVAGHVAGKSGQINQPLIAGMGGVLVLDERFRPAMVPAAACMFAAIFLVTRKPGPKNRGA